MRCHGPCIFVLDASHIICRCSIPSHHNSLPHRPTNQPCHHVLGLFLSRPLVLFPHFPPIPKIVSSSSVYRPNRNHRHASSHSLGQSGIKPTSVPFPALTTRHGRWRGLGLGSARRTTGPKPIAVRSGVTHILFHAISSQIRSHLTSHIHLICTSRITSRLHPHLSLPEHSIHASLLTTILGTRLYAPT